MGCCSSCLCVVHLEGKVNARFQNSSAIIAKEILWVSLRYLRSNGCCQVKGNGALVLTADLLWFSYLCLNRPIEIGIHNIRSVKVGSGKVMLDFVDTTTGIEDQVVFSIRDAQMWGRIIIETVYKSANSIPPSKNDNNTAYSDLNVNL